MKERIERLKSIQDDWQSSEFNPPATETQIAEFEENTGISIPNSYKDFLRLSNGAELSGGDCQLYSVDMNDKFRINYDFSEGSVPEELLILGFYNSQHICFDKRYESFIFYEYEDYNDISEECLMFSDFYEVMDYIIDIAEN
ncbi:SMI1/KNR4 family protein [Ruminococcus flavefaciens]|uniref:SMI1 / KNR4 family (SUKH-1) n=1 Tax=Ruminococcus flavefaciens TaxID=1265 RepID=A0A1M7MCK9_RUMFL|nr:SMI1/KNR4 family protein [Ruminococcus flavefaciens]SHM88466.1 SMI1 / KNR4 family (SUKH-1) [Ruminococcus flavefaciens]